MTERRDPDQQRRLARSPETRPAEAGPDAALADLQREAGNKAVADLLGRASVQRDPASPGIRLRDALRAGRTPVQREFGLGVQRIEKEAIKQLGRLLRRGSRGGDVSMVQAMLGVNADGIFGRDTLNRVIEFQAANGLVPDGIVGPLTFSALQTATGGTGKLEPAADKLGGGSADKLPPETAAKLPPESTAKLPPESTDKLASNSTEKLGELKL